MERNGMFNECTIMNVFTKQKAAPQQAKDMLGFRAIGRDAYMHYIKYRVISEPSTGESAPVRKQQLLTLAPNKVLSKRKFNEKEKELRDVTKLLRRRLEWCRLTGEQYDPNEQYSIYPRALCSNQGIPHTGSKSLWLTKLLGRYTTSAIK